MSVFSVIVSVGEFNNRKNPEGSPAVYLDPLYGKIPAKAKVKSTAFMEMNGIVAGNCYFLIVKEAETDPTYGKQYEYKVISKVSALELIQNGDEYAVSLGAGTTVEKKELVDLTL